MRKLSYMLLAIMVIFSIYVISSFAGFITTPTHHIKDLEVINNIDGETYDTHYYNLLTLSVTTEVPLPTGTSTPTPTPFGPKAYTGIPMEWHYNVGYDYYDLGMLTLDHDGVPFDSSAIRIYNDIGTSFGPYESHDSCADLKGSVYFMTTAHFFEPSSDEHYYRIRIGERYLHQGDLKLCFSEDDGELGLLPQPTPDQTQLNHRRISDGPRMVCVSEPVTNWYNINTKLYVVWTEFKTLWSDDQNCYGTESRKYLKIGKVYDRTLVIGTTPTPTPTATATPLVGTYEMEEDICDGISTSSFDAVYDPGRDRILVAHCYIPEGESERLVVNEINPSTLSSTIYSIPNTNGANYPKLFCDSLYHNPSWSGADPAVYLCYKKGSSYYVSLYNRGDTVSYEISIIPDDWPDVSLSGVTNPSSTVYRRLFLIYELGGIIKMAWWNPNNNDDKETGIEIVKTSNKVYLSSSNKVPQIGTVQSYSVVNSELTPSIKYESYIVWIGEDQSNNRHVYGRRWSNGWIRNINFNCVAVAPIASSTVGTWVFNATPTPTPLVYCGEGESTDESVIAEFIAHNNGSYFTTRSQIYNSNIQKVSLTQNNLKHDESNITELRMGIMEDPSDPFDTTPQYSSTFLAEWDDPVNQALGGTDGRDISDIFHFWNARPITSNFEDYLVLTLHDGYPDIHDCYARVAFWTGPYSTGYARIYTKYIDWIEW